MRTERERTHACTLAVHSHAQTTETILLSAACLHRCVRALLHTLFRIRVCLVHHSRDSPAVYLCVKIACACMCACKSRARRLRTPRRLMHQFIGHSLRNLFEMQAMCPGSVLISGRSSCALFAQAGVAQLGAARSCAEDAISRV